jgi:hypothetical protein
MKTTTSEPQHMNAAMLQELDRLRLKVRQQEAMIRAQAEKIKELQDEIALVSK